MLKNYINILKQKKGMSLVEVMTAMVILTLMIFCFAPLFLSYFNSIDIAGKKIDEVYHESGIMQRVIGNMNKSQTQDSDGYITPFQSIPLTLTSENSVSIIKTESSKDGSGKLTVGVVSDGDKAITNGATIKTKAADADGELTDISGGLLLSNPNNMDDSMMSFYASSIDAGFYCYPNSITDDFIKKDIIVIAKGMAASCSGFEVYVNVDNTTVSKNTDLYESYDAKFGGKLKGDTNNNGTVDAGVSWSIEPLAGVSDAFVLSVYGGRGVSFENSPLIIKYGIEYKTVEVDAPMMIMVGEANKNGDYNYYVSRGEVVDPDYNGVGERKPDTLAVLQRTMKGDTPLTSAMNDVEWVDEESADSYTDGKKIDGTRYGYYVMCGDNGQVRRFWRNADVLTTDSNGNQIVEYGNYYWGGDYTYYTDYNLNRFDSGGTYIKTKDLDGKTDKAGKNYSTNVSFKYIAMRPMYWSEGSVPKGGLFSNTSAPNEVNKYRTGFNMSGKKYRNLINAVDGIANLRNLCTVSATYSDNVEFYGSDGKLFPYVTKYTAIPTGNQVQTGTDCDGNPTYETEYNYYGPLTENVPSYEQIRIWQTSGGSFQNITVEATSSLGLKSFSDEAWGWLDPGDGTSSYYRIYGLTDSNNKPTVNTTSYPITLTSVDAIRINGTGGSYETNVTDTGKSHFFTSGVSKDADTSGDLTVGSNASASTSASTNLEYPMSNYVLYCGYIPAYMDAWGGTTGNAKYPKTVQFAGDQGQYAKVWDVNANRNVGQYSKVGRASNRQQLGDNSEYNTIWRMTMGITPFYAAADEGINQGYIGYAVTYDDGKTGNTVVYYPYSNVSYAITGKYYDQATYNQNRAAINVLFSGVSEGVTIASPSLISSPASDRQTSTTAGKVIDVTISYLSHPLAISIAANPTDDIVYDLSNDKDSSQIFYWHNRRESITFLDSASTVVPNGENDVPVSLMVGYVLGGTVLYGEKKDSASVDVTSVMNNGIVFLRAGEASIARHGVDTSAIESLFGGNSANSMTGEYKAVDSTGYKLAQESNVFHQFYYLDSYTRFEKEGSGSGAHSEYAYKPEAGKNIGNLYGADYWQNNRHILNRSIYGGTPSNGTGESYEYLRAHPLADTKVNCVAWGVTWEGKPEAMWGTDNGTVLSWWVDTTTTQGSHNNYDWNNRSVDAEIQSYKWVDSVNGKTYKQTKGYPDSLGSAVWGSGNSNGTSYALGSGVIPATFKYFCDKGTQATGAYATLGFINTLENINDIEYADDVWVAVGDQSDKNPADYSASGVEYQNNRELKANEHWETIRAYSGTGKGGSWVNVRYWVDLGADGKHSAGNATYHWRAVQITDKKNCNIVQINNVNGMWIATGYQDANNNDEYDTGETPVVCWTYDPLVPYGEDGGWSDKVEFYQEGATSETSGKIDKSLIGGINSCATRS